MKGFPIIYSKKELRFIESRKKMPRSALHFAFVEKFGRGDVCLNNITQLCKRKKWLTGRTGRFIPGHTPDTNSGPRGPNGTTFRKGRTSHTRVSIGSLFKRNGYLLIKIGDPNEWKLAHIVMWEKKNGPLPAGHCINFIDGDRTNISIENLDLVSRIQHLEINRLGELMNGATRTVARTLGKLIGLTHEKKGSLK